MAITIRSPNHTEMKKCDWRDEVQISENDDAYRDRFIAMLSFSGSQLSPGWTMWLPEGLMSFNKTWLLHQRPKRRRPVCWRTCLTIEARTCGLLALQTAILCHIYQVMSGLLAQRDAGSSPSHAWIAPTFQRTALDTSVHSTK